VAEEVDKLLKEVLVAEEEVVLDYLILLVCPLPQHHL
jgi:hypothetical protein